VIGKRLGSGKGMSRRLAVGGAVACLVAGALSYRISMGPRETLPVFHCRLLSFVSNTPIPAERRCFRLLTTAK